MLFLPWHDSWTPNCAGRHIGYWLVEGDWFNRAVLSIDAEMWQRDLSEIRKISKKEEDQVQQNVKPYSMDDTGIAVIYIQDQMMKGYSKYGGTNSVAVRRQIRIAREDPDVHGIMIHIDSPGGTVSGTEELGADIYSTRKYKPIFSHIDGLGGSAAYWVASQTQRITASSTSEIGSIGTVAVIEDYSKSYEKRGVRVRVFSTGPYKGAGIDGTELTPEQEEYYQERVNSINDQFLAAVANGRNVSIPKVQEWSDGRVWIAETARQKGLIDGVMLFDDAMAAARDYVEKQANPIPIPTKRTEQKRDVRSILAEMEKRLDASILNQV